MSTPTDHDVRIFATDPLHNVVLEASAGTGKTSVLVDRYLNLLRAGVAPVNILAITFTRQAAGEMRARIVDALQREATESERGRQRWDNLRERLPEVAISTVDAFCLSLLREFPLEADLDPGFSMADETEVPRLVEEAIDRALVAAAHLAAADPGVAALLARLGPARTRVALRRLLERRLVVPAVLQRFLTGVPRDLTGERVCRDAVGRLTDHLSGLRREVAQLVDEDVLDDPRAAILARDLKRLPDLLSADPATIRAWLERLRDAFLTKGGNARRSFPLRSGANHPQRRRYRLAAASLAPHIRDVMLVFDRDVNAMMTRAVQRLFGVVTAEYQRALRSRALLDFTDVLQRAVDLLRHMDEFARSRYRLESRYHHVLVDEFQDTSRAQWELVSLLVQSWGEGSGLVADAPLPPSIFVVGDRKQSIYRFRDADVTTFVDATNTIAALRADADVQRTISQSFRAVPRLLGFINDLFGDIGAAARGQGSFRFGAADRFPLAPDPDDVHDAALGLVTGDDIHTCAEAVADEIVTLLDGGQVRRERGPQTRVIRPEDIAVLFRTRESHREFEQALDRRAVPTYVYKSLGFFDADEIKDARALMRFLANPSSELRAAALMRSRIVGVSDPGLLVLAGQLRESLLGDDLPSAAARLTDDDQRVLEQARLSLRQWVELVDRMSPAEVLDRALSDAAYAFELRGAHVEQAEANLRRLRDLVRRVQNRGYATMARVVDHIDHLSADMSNAVIERLDAVNLMTVHAAKGLEFPIVFLVDLGRGTRAHDAPVRVVSDRGDGRPSVSVWPYRSEADEEERRRDLEETKRLLYVATTRARDRLYLSIVVEAGTPRISPGSFASILPADFMAVFERVVTTGSGDHVIWRGQSGSAHTFRVCSVSAVDTEADQDSWPQPGRALPELAVHSVRAIVGGMAKRLVVVRVPSDTDDAVSAPSAHVSEERTKRKERVSRVKSSVASQTQLWSVPFSHRDPHAAVPTGAETVVVRGTIDCLARDREGRVTVFAFKDGPPRAEHQTQLDRHVTVARAMFPGAPVEGRLVYG